MKPVALALVILTCSAAALAQTAPRSATASKPMPPGAPASSAQPPVSTSPVVRASEEAAVPGELRPENRVIPQLSVPLRRDRDAKADIAASSAKTGAVDDGPARRAASRPAPQK